MRGFLGALLILLCTARPDSQAADQTRPRAASYRVPAGTALLLKLKTPLNSASTRPDAQVDATLWSPVIQDGVELIPAGSLVIGKVVDVTRASKKKPVGELTFIFTVIEHQETGSRAMIKTKPLIFEAPVERREDAVTVLSQPLDAVIPADTPIAAMTTEPLIVYLKR